MSLPVILRHEAELDIQEARDQLEPIRVGLGNQVLARVREVLARIEEMPELHGKVWEDVRAARLKQFRYIVYFIVLADRVEVLAVLHSVSFGASKPATHRRLKTGHRVGGTGWKNPLNRTFLQG